MIKQIRFIIAETFMKWSMSILPPGTEERRLFADFIRDKYSKATYD